METLEDKESITRIKMAPESISTDFSESQSYVESAGILSPMSNYAMDQQDLESSYKSIVKLEPSSPHFVACNENFDDLAAETSGSFSQDPLEMEFSEELQSDFKKSTLVLERRSQRCNHIPRISSAFALEDVTRDEDDRTLQIDVNPQISESVSLDLPCSTNSGTDKQEVRFRCAHCPKTFKHVHSRDVHQRRHSAGKPFSCDKCKKSFKGDVCFQRHLKTHCGVTCETCGKTFSFKRQLNRHTQIHDKQHVCEECGKVFSFQYKLQIHMRIHTGYRPFRCDTCDQRFTTKSALKVHRVSHSDERPFQCDTCKRSFKSKGHIKGHIVCHSNKPCQPIQCPTCAQLFSSKVQLKLHQRRRAVVRPYRCVVCDCAFASKKTLQSHCTRLHEDEEERRCAICGEMFEQRVWLSHARTHRRTCGECGLTFMLPSDFIQHRKHHCSRFECLPCRKIFRDYSLYMIHMKGHIDASLRP